MFGVCFNHPGSVFYKDYRRQLTATFTINIIAFSHGIALGWVAPMLLKLQSKNSPLTFDISVQEASWIGALISIGGMIGNVVFGYLLERFGRKISVYLVALPHICLWVEVFFASNVYHLYMARIFGGITGGGICIVLPIFVSEIADCRIRGTLGSLFLFSINNGIMVGFIIASHVQFFIIPCIVVVLPMLYLLLWTKYPETPQYLIRKGLLAKAEDSMKFYKNYSDNTKEAFQKFNTEFTNLRMSIQSAKSQQTVSLADFCNKRSMKALITGVTLVFVNMGSGIFAILNYSSMIFAETGSKMDPNTNTIIIGAVQITGSCCVTFLVDEFGRKILLMVSSAGMCLGMTAIGVYSYLANQIDLSNVTWLPVVLMSFVIFLANIGVIPVTFVALVEILPPKIRSLGTTICLLLLSAFGFAILKGFPILMVVIGTSGVMWICAAVSGFGFFFFVICLQETRGKSLDNDSDYN